MVSSNLPTSRHHGAPKHGEALLAGLIRCQRCGRTLTLRYSAMKNHIPLQLFARLDGNGEPRCIAFGGLRVDDAIEEALLGVIEPGAVAAAAFAAARPHIRGIKFAKRSAVIFKRPVTLPIAPSGNMTLLIRQTAWLPLNLRCAGIARLPASRRWRARLRRMMRRRYRRRSIQRGSAFWPQTSSQSGEGPPPMRGCEAHRSYADPRGRCRYR